MCKDKKEEEKMFKHISENKYEFNVRRVAELDRLLLEKERQLSNTTGLLNTFKLKSEIKKLYKLIVMYGNEVIEYEYNKANFELN